VSPINIKDVTEEEFILPGRSGCAGCAGILVARLALKILGESTIMVSSTGCVLSNFTHAGSPRIPYMHSLFPGAGSLVAGIDAGLKALGKREGVNLFVLAGDGATADIGLGSLSGAMERGHRFLYICYDNEGYMNTGGQRSGTTPVGSSTATTPSGHGNRLSSPPLPMRKDIVSIMAAHRIPYVATASPAFPQDLLRKIQRASSIDGPAYIHVLTPCNYRWGFDEDKSIEVARLAVQSRIFPLIEIENGWSYRLTVKSRRKVPVHDYLSMQKRFRHLSDAEVAGIQSIVDRNWARLLKLIGNQE